MKSMSSFDIKACVKELQQLVNGRVEKIYHHPPDEIRIKVYSQDGRKDLIIEAGKRIHTTKFPKQSPRYPSSFAMILRKHLEGGRIREIEQYDFDRIVKITVERQDERRLIIAELFSKGNVVLANEDFEVIMPLKFRFKPRERYRFPEPKNPVGLVEEITEFAGKDVVRVLAGIGLGGLYAEEVCLIAGVEKNKKIEELEENEIKSIKKTVLSLFKAVESELRPQIVIKNEEYIDVVPLSLKYYENLEKRFFDSFNSALDEFYSKKIVEMAEKEEKRSEKLEKLKKRLELQLETKKRFEMEVEKYKRIGDLIYENYTNLERIVDAFKKAREKMSWNEILEFINNKDKKGLISIVRSIKPNENTIVVEIEHPIELNLNKNLHQIADEYYNKSKKIKEKLDGLMEAIKKTEREMENIEEIEAKKYVESIRVVRKREWYEKFRWFFTSDGFLVIGGRNAAMNEEIVSKHLESKDLFFHTQSPGAPATVLKNGQNAPEQSLIEAAEFAVTYSSLWKEGKYGGEVYYVKPEQVKRAAKAGEYLPRGSFYITGKREYIHASVSCGVGVELERFRVFGGPLSAVKKYCDYYVELDIGNLQHNELAKEIASKLISMAREEEKHIVRGIATLDEIMKFLPPGRSRIKE